MADSPLLSKSKSFALEIIKVCNEIKSSKRESVLTNQLIRSGTSIGANIREAFYGHSKADFISKLQIALKEANETNYWLELLLKTNYIDDASLILNTESFNQVENNVILTSTPAVLLGHPGVWRRNPVRFAFPLHQH